MSQSAIPLRTAIAHGVASLRRIPPSAWRVLSAAFLTGLGSNLNSLFLNFHLESLGFDRTLIGYANAAPLVSVVAFGIPLGLAMPRIGAVQSRLLASGIGAASLGLIAAAFSTEGIFVGLVGFGVGRAMVVAASVSLLTRLVPESQRVLALSLQSALHTGAGFLGSLGGGQLPALLGGTDAVLYTGAGMYALSLVPLWGLLGHNVRGEVRRFRLGSPRIWGKLLLPQAIIAFGAGLTIPFLNLYLRDEFGLPYEWVGAMFAVSSLATMGAMLIQPVLSHRFGKIGAITATQGVSLPFILVLAYVPILPLVALAMFTRGALMNAGRPVETALAMAHVNEGEREAYMMTQRSIRSLSRAGAASLSGSVQTALGGAAFDYLFAAMFVLYATAILVYLAFFGLRRPEA